MHAGRCTRQGHTTVTGCCRSRAVQNRMHDIDDVKTGFLIISIMRPNIKAKHIRPTGESRGVVGTASGQTREKETSSVDGAEAAVGV